MNEPAIFVKPEMTMPEDNRHTGYGGGPHAQYSARSSFLIKIRFHNVYGMLMAKATRDGIVKARPQLRPFVLSRANFLGGQKCVSIVGIKFF